MQFNLVDMFKNMGGVAIGVVIVLAIMSVYSIGVMIERFWTFKHATDQSRKYAPEVARFLKQGNIKQAIDAGRVRFEVIKLSGSEDVAADASLVAIEASAVLNVQRSSFSSRL